MLAWVVIDRRHLRQPRKSHLPRALRANGSPFDFQLSTFNLRIAPSPTFLALCPKSVKQVSSRQSLPHSFLKLPGVCQQFPKWNSPLNTRHHHSSSFFSNSCALFCAFSHSRKKQLVSFQAIPHSLSKNTRGWG